MDRDDGVRGRPGSFARSVCAMSEDLAGRAPSSDLRASDADRERLAGELRDHAVAGRIDTDELEARLQAAYAARTLGNLDALRRDLPATPEQVAIVQRERRARLVRRTVHESGGSLAAFVVCSAIWVASGASGFFWPLFVLIGVLGLLARNGWDLFGPAADFDAVEARLDSERRKREDDERWADYHRRRDEGWADHRARHDAQRAARAARRERRRRER